MMELSLHIAPLAQQEHLFSFRMPVKRPTLGATRTTAWSEEKGVECVITHHGVVFMFYKRKHGRVAPCSGGPACSVLAILCLILLGAQANANHEAHETHAGEDSYGKAGPGYSIPGASFRVFLKEGSATTDESSPEPKRSETVVQTVVAAFTFMLHHRSDFPRFDEAVKKGVLQSVVIEPKVVNREGKEFAFLVARTNEPGRVKLLVSAASLMDKGYLHKPEQLATALAREFQWVVSKADTAPKPRTILGARELRRAPIRADREILRMPPEKRVGLLQQLFDTYLTTVDDQNSLAGQPYYEVGMSTPVQPAQPDSTMKLYEIRVREALQKIVGDPYFMEHTPKAVRSLLNGKVWNVSFVKIDQRDWATRTRVVPEDKSVLVGEQGSPIQPAKILVNTYRTAAPDDPFYQDTKGLPMGALSTDQLARVIALEIQGNILEKSMRGHVAQDALTAPQ